MNLSSAQTAVVVLEALKQLKEYTDLWEIHQDVGCDCDFCKLYEDLNQEPEIDA
jgi:hypothetical protein